MVLHDILIDVGLGFPRVTDDNEGSRMNNTNHVDNDVPHRGVAIAISRVRLPEGVDNYGCRVVLADQASQVNTMFGIQYVERVVLDGFSIGEHEALRIVGEALR